MHIVVGPAPGGVVLTPDESPARFVPDADFASTVALLERDHPRWVWDTARWYPGLLARGVRVDRCIDLRLSHAILSNSALTTFSGNSWSSKVDDPDDPHALFAFEPEPEADPVAEWALQKEAGGRLGLLLAAESAGALIAAEMRFAGMPWRADVHDAILTELLGPRPVPGERPAALTRLLEAMRTALDVADLNPDSPVELLKGLARGGVRATSTRSWELRRIDHPVIPLLLEYKKLARLASANGWQWLDTWVHDGRFHPDYVVGGVVTGRWATSGGGALQLPKQIRRAVVADEGWKLIVADAAQLEPRILAALSGDRGMLAAGADDLYAGIVASGAIDTREHAKVALLGAMYGATTGDSARLMPGLERAYPRAIALVEQAARAGERGEVVSTHLGRSSPPPSAEWRELQADAYGENATDAARSRARSEARSWGRFTRNFIVQGTAAEWALCWMANLRRRLIDLDPAWPDGPHLVFFLHDEVVVHTPEALAEQVAEAVRAAAEDAGRQLFGALPARFPVTVAVVDDYGQAK